MPPSRFVDVPQQYLGGKNGVLVWNLSIVEKEMKSNTSNFPQAGNPSKAFQEHPPPFSFQSQVCSLMLLAVHGNNTFVRLLAAVSSWSLHHLGHTLIRILLAVERPFPGCTIHSACRAVRSLEASSALTPKAFWSFQAHQGCTWSQVSVRSAEAGFSDLEAQWHRSGGVWLESHSEVGSLWSLPKCIALGKVSAPPGSADMRHSCWDVSRSPEDCQAFCSRIK